MGKITTSFRLLRAGWVLAREGVFSALPVEGLPGLPALGHKLAGLLARRRSRRRERSERMARALHKLGPTYIKLGQFLATRPDLVGRDVAEDLSALQDRVRTFSQTAAIRQIEKSLGRPVPELFAEFEAPIAAASMAQVHPAYVRGNDGILRKVAVKVIRPGLRQAFARDLQGFYLAAESVERHMPAIRRLRPVSMVDNLLQVTRLEMDLRLEAAALSETAENIAGDSGFRVPEVDWERTGRDVLTMEWIDGIKMSDRETLIAVGYNVQVLAVTLMQSFLRHALRDGFFHADMHPGNLFVDKDGMIVAVDFGITGRLGKKEKRFLAEILYGFIKRDYRRVAEVHFAAGYVPPHHDIASFAQANRAIGEPIHGQSAETISMARLLGLLFEVTELFDMQTRPELILLQKTMVVVEGVSRSLDPHFNMWKAAEPVVGEWIAHNLGPIGMAKDMKEGMQALTMLARKTPEFVRRFEETTAGLHKQAENGLHLDDDTISRLARAQARNGRFNRFMIFLMVICIIAFTFKLFL
ncbi:MAG: Ubiquinone biosynthesis protein AarF [Candidatus Tokpelaia hoelldobleri]|uniref:Ubiquinone biosynthesis protein AarF n=1 Tax=Candidatus Tokpelaia hoelldobleri TaxID=1902579 RepID=A0A1U9JSI9_9HYPH|nr:MAG: Ubiquinone biosynthesis protein AarF [Candidatus Tokpelaia hoelldoblerii]